MPFRVVLITMLTNFKYSVRNQRIMHVDRKMIEHVAEVARLRLTEDELTRFLPELTEVLETFSQLSEVDTDGVKPSFQPVELHDALRDDTVTPSLSQDEALSNSPSTKDGYFKGPRAI
jgi:aspartyl-tRNA(Asn)/glutamyl-tRNA(Gln) amidotransferase subunit C